MKKHKLFLTVSLILISALGSGITCFAFSGEEAIEAVPPAPAAYEMEAVLTGQEPYEIAGLYVTSNQANGNMLTAETALLLLENSIIREKDNIIFTIPPYGAGEWSLHISGRAVYEDGFSMSLHYLEEEEWTAGKTYSLQPDDAAEELVLSVYLNDPAAGKIERHIDLLQK